MQKSDNGKVIFIDRPPRIQPELPFKEIEIPAPPDRESNPWLQLLQLAMPLVMIVGTVMIGITSGGGALIIIPMTLAIVASLAVSLYTYRMEQRKRLEQEKRYNQRLIDLNKEMQNYHDLQRRFYAYNYPDTDSIYRFVQNARREVEKSERTLRSEARLWERRVADQDFGAVRLGMGTLPSTVVYVLPHLENYDDPLTRAAMKLAEDSRFVHDIPVVIALRQHGKKPGEIDEAELTEQKQFPPMPFTHALAVAGERDQVYPFIRALVMHYAVFHQASEARLYVLGQSARAWEWTEKLPHCQADQQGAYRCFVDALPTDADVNPFDDVDGDGYDQFLEGLRKVLSQRKIRLAERGDREQEVKDDTTLPHLLVVVDLLEATYDKSSRLSKLEEDAAISILLEEGASLGATVVFLVPERAKAPGRCASVLEIESTTPASNSRIQQFQRLHFRFAEVGVNSTRYVGEADLFEQPARVMEMAERLALTQVRQGFGATVPAAVLFFDLMGLRGMQHCLAETVTSWQASTAAKNANWLRAKIGLMSGNKPRTLIFSAKRDGVHGMVAGSTGSGKSELLISLIAAMSVTYDPTVLNFVLVDFKGGGAFKGFEELPHCVDIITNLQGDAVNRMFTAITAEIQRRQKLNADTNTKNIVDYRQKNLHIEREPYPFLFIIIDEFAEMIAERPEYKTQLESITRVGRAQGVSLILAAQRPSGVTDQMRSNIKFRICLRVETSGESREMLRREDAAYLPSLPGRGYLQVGNEEIELIQVAYTGEKYVDPTRQQIPVIWPDRGDKYDPTIDQEPPELYRAIVLALEKLALIQSVPKQSAPWPNVLPQHLALVELLVAADPKRKAITTARYLRAEDLQSITLGQPPPPDLTLNPALTIWLNGDEADDRWIERLDWENYALRPVVGLVDHPMAARQLPLLIELQRGHVVIFGAGGWGKTTFLRTLVVSLAATHSPNHLWIYVLDLGGRSLNPLKAFPQVGAVIIPDEVGFEERVEQLFRTLEELVDKRKNLLALAGQPDLYKYNQANPANPEPAVLVAIDNILEFKETFDKGDDNVASVMDKFVSLARQSKQFGIHFVITAGKSADLSTQLFSIFTERLTLKLADPTEARSLIGAYIGEIPDIHGRGYVKIGADALSFQVAVPLELREGENENKQLEQLAQTMRDYVQSRSGRTWRKPIGVESLPTAILFKQLLSREYGWEINEGFLARLQAHTAQEWQASREATQADWLRVTVGALPGNRVRTMNFRADRDGVHGMIAGGTGSGKSELLMTMIVGMAMTYDPTILNFVLVDFKGGGAFTPFKDLPHCVDMVTNLNRSAVRRFFTAINAEMGRRQKLNTDTGTKHIVEYREKGYHLSHAPYPHLFIIIDEYAEMISANPEYKAELESIARLGRAQGVNLLLAAQRPTGVTDQMRANIKYRICLRVEEVDTSREMLRRSDAAFLPSVPGRGYLQVGNEGVELIQTAYTGEEEKYAPQVEMPDGRAPKFYDAVVHLSQQLLAAAGQTRPRTPWPTPLPTKLLLSDPLQGDYLLAEDLPVLTVADNTPPTFVLNPRMQAWLRGAMDWPGVDWRAEQGNALRAVVGLVDDPANSCQLPLTVDLTRGNVVIFGDASSGKTTLLRTLIASLATTHAPNEVHIHVIDMGGQTLKLLAHLPHLGTIITPDGEGFAEQVQQLWRRLNEEIEQRKRQLADAGLSTLSEYNVRFPADVLPAVVVLVDNFGEYLENFGKDANPDDETNLLYQFMALARTARAYGIHFVITVPRYNTLTNTLHSLFTERFALRLADFDDYRSVLNAGVPELDAIPGRGYQKIGRGEPLEFQVAVALAERSGSEGQTQLLNELPLLRQLADALHTASQGRWSADCFPLRIGALASKASYRDQLSTDLAFVKEQSFMAQLAEKTRARWQHNALAEQADWLRVAIGLVSGNRSRELYLAAKADGVHGLIAGGTGSGKSELLTTLICGLALNYDPTILNFVLVDYKGGGAFKPFERLPHCVDIVTNLNKAAVQRMFTSINAEIRRRQELNARTGTKDIVDYRAKGLHLNGPAYPHLFIIIDEYAEMIDDNPDYKIELESITRVGRAQGINLLLASQRPKGVTDQMRANMKLRICLRVEELDTSREMLRRPDAALLPSIPGRGYLQVGNEGLELFQSGFTGEKQWDDREAAALWPVRPPVVSEQGEPPRLFNAVVNLASELWQGQMAPKPWPGFLPDRLTLQAPIYDAQHNRHFTLTQAVSDWLNGESEQSWSGVDWETTALRPVVGLIDHPAEARQEPLVLDLQRAHLVVYGDSGTGKTSFLRTLLVSLAATHSPNELHTYVIDLGGRNFRSLEDLPHLAALLYGDEETFEERLNRLMEKLTVMTLKRQQVFAEAGVNTLYEYNLAQPDKALPAILVLIDNFTPLWETQEALLEAVVGPLLRKSLSVGMSFVITANGPPNVPGRLAALFGQAITFRQANFDRYLDIVGRGCVEIDHIPGRGYMRVDRTPLMFQMALPVGLAGADGGRDPRPEAEELRLLAQNMRQQLVSGRSQWRNQPEPILILTEQVSLQRMLSEAAAPRPKRIEGVLGENERLLPALFDLKRFGPHFAVCGPPLSGKSTVLYNWIISLTLRYSPEQVGLVVIDLQNKFFDWGGDYQLHHLPHVIATVSEKEDLAALTENLQRECAVLFAKETTRELYMIIDNYDDFSDETEKEWEMVRTLASLARRHGRDGLHLIIGGALEGTGNDLRRQVQAANYGIGLRTESALDTLRVAKRPPGLKGKELPVGRGYIVKAGEATMIQVASPYELSELVISDEEERVALALDAWVRQIVELYPAQQAAWSQPAVGSATAASSNGVSSGAGFDDETVQLFDLLKRVAAYRDPVETDESDDGYGPTILPGLAEAEVDMADWDYKRVLLKLIGDALQRKTGMDVNRVYQDTPSEIVAMALDTFPALTNGVASVSETETAATDF